MSAYKIVSAVIPERVDDSMSDRYLVVAPEDKIVWVTTDNPQDLSPEARKRAVHKAGILSLLNKIKREENAVESESLTQPGVPAEELIADVICGTSEAVLAVDDDEAVDDILDVMESWEEEIH